MRKITRRSFLAAAAVCGAAAALTACGGSSASSTAASSVASSAAAGSAAASGDTYTIGICQLVQHAALDAATQGFEDALTAEDVYKRQLTHRLSADGLSLSYKQRM